MDSRSAVAAGTGERCRPRGPRVPRAMPRRRVTLRQAARRVERDDGERSDQLACARDRHTAAVPPRSRKGTEQLVGLSPARARAGVRSVARRASTNRRSGRIALNDSCGRSSMVSTTAASRASETCTACGTRSHAARQVRITAASASEQVDGRPLRLRPACPRDMLSVNEGRPRRRRGGGAMPGVPPAAPAPAPL